jgi:hypothetical protein
LRTLLGYQLPPARRGDASVVESVGDLLQRGRTCLFHLLNDWMTLAAKRSASALPASPPLPRIAARLGLPSFTPAFILLTGASDNREQEFNEEKPGENSEGKYYYIQAINPGDGRKRP